MKRAKIIICGSLFILALILLVFFPEISLISVGKISLGTITSWLALILYSMFWYYLLPDYLNVQLPRNLKRLKEIYFLLALFWGFISALLAGNWNFSFQNKQTRFDVWILFTGFLVVAPFLVLIILWVRRMRK